MKGVLFRRRAIVSFLLLVAGAAFLLTNLPQEFDISETLQRRAEGSQTPVKHKQRLIHVDFKGAPPTQDYVRQLVGFAKTVGATGFLMEYEVLFPYAGKTLWRVRTDETWHKDTVAKMVTDIDSQGLMVVPTLPIFDGMEFVLRLSSFRQLRQKPADVSCMSTTEDSVQLLQDMLSQLVFTHPTIKYFHLGGLSAACRRGLQRQAQTDTDMSNSPGYTFFQQVATSLIQSNVRPIVFDSVLDIMTPAEQAKVADVADVMLRLDQSVVGTLDDRINRLRSAGFDFSESLWIAPSFRGNGFIDGDRSIASLSPRPLAPSLDVFPDTVKHMSRLASDLPRINSLKEISGFVFLGPSRQDSLSTLAPLLPASIPLLTFEIASVLEGKPSTVAANRALSWIKLTALPRDEQRSLSSEIDMLSTRFDEQVRHRFRMGSVQSSVATSFPGAECWVCFSDLAAIHGETLLLQHQRVEHASSYLIAHSRVHPVRVNNILRRAEAQLKKMEDIEACLSSSLSNITFDFAVSEFIETHVDPLKQTLLGIVQELQPVVSSMANTLYSSDA